MTKKTGISFDKKDSKKLGQEKIGRSLDNKRQEEALTIKDRKKLWQKDRKKLWQKRQKEALGKKTGRGFGKKTGRSFGKKTHKKALAKRL